MLDVGLTHVALHVTNLDSSASFYNRYAKMHVVHRRYQASHQDKEIGWLSDGSRPFALVLAETDSVEGTLGPFAHLGVACGTINELRELCAIAEAEGVLRQPPKETGGPAGTYAMLNDPDGHTLELSFGQEVAYTIGDHYQTRFERE